MQFFWITNVLVLVCIKWINGQLLYGCPSGWELYQNNCYRFEKDSPLIYEEADAACWVDFSTLLTIETYGEHKYISDWLMRHDAHKGTVWFTGGLYKNGQLLWDGQPTQLTGYWVQNRPPLFNETNVRVGYVFGGPLFDGYGWKVVPASTPSSYICEVPRSEIRDHTILQRGFDYGLGIMNHNEIKFGPKIIKEPDNVVIFDEMGPDVYIDCAASGNPFPSYKWTRDNGTEVTSSTSNRYTITGGRFTIQRPVEDLDADKYQCVATNTFGTTISNPADIIFGSLGSFSPVKPEDVSANKFEGTRISCQAPAAYPEAKYQWFQWTTEEFIWEDHPYMFVSSSGYLYFSEVQPTDSRRYFCSVTLSAPDTYIAASSQPPSRTSLGVWLLVMGTEHGFFEPYIYTHTFPSPALRGSRIRIECIAYGSLPLLYSWHREDGRPFQAGTTISDNSRVLTIPNALIESEGNYVCTVNGKGGVAHKTITLVIEARPYFPFSIGDKLVDPGQTLKWRCKCVARPAAIYKWFKNGVPIEVVPGKVEIRQNFLYIQSIDAARDEGMYQCGATNIHGTTFSSGQLKVLSFKPNFLRYPLPPVTQIPLGGNYTIACRVEAAPVPDVVWMKDGGILPVTPGNVEGRIGMTMENDLVFHNIDFNDQGRYTCKATNVNGEATNSTSVQVIRDISIMRPPSDTTVKVNRTAFLYCQASFDSLNFDLTYVWKFNGHIIDFTLNPHYVLSQREGADGLYITQAQYQLQGVYTCEARTTLHVDSKSATLIVIGPPGAPAGVYVETSSVTPHSVRLVWTTSGEIEHGNPIKSYDIEAEVGIYPGQWKIVASDVFDYIAKTEATTFGLRDDQRSIIIDGLYPHVSYSFRVRAVNDFGRGQEASKGSVMVKTPAMAPVVAPSNIHGVEEAKVGTLTIVWDPLDPTEQGGPGIGYNVYFRKENDPKDWFKAVVPGNQPAQYTHLVGEENFYLPYEVKVSAFNRFGGGPNSSETIVMSAEGMPIARVVMGDCDNYNGSAFSMSWTPIEDTREIVRGRLKGYRIRYWHKEFPDFVTYRDLYGQHDSTIIIGLDDNTNYWASVQVMNYAGVGPIGEIRLAETFHLPPRQYPRHVMVYPHSEHSVRITWQGISTEFDEETLQGYYIKVWKVQEDIRTAVSTRVDKVMEAILDGLQIHTVYVLRVLGYSIGGEGKHSPHVYFTVEGGNVPFDPSTTRFCFDNSNCNAATTRQAMLSIPVTLVTLLFLAFMRKHFS